MSDKKRECIYCGGRILDGQMSGRAIQEEITIGLLRDTRCSCPNVKKAEAEGGALVHWAKRKQSVFSMCSDPDTHRDTAHLISLKSEPLPDDAQVTCMDCIAVHG